MTVFASVCFDSLYAGTEYTAAACLAANPTGTLGSEIPPAQSLSGGYEGLWVYASASSTGSSPSWVLASSASSLYVQTYDSTAEVVSWVPLGSVGFAGSSSSGGAGASSAGGYLLPGLDQPSAVAISGAILLLWATAWCIRQIVRFVRVS